MKRASRIRRVLKWAGLAASFLALPLWAWSFADSTIHDFGTPAGSDLVRGLQLVEGECNFVWSFYPAASMTMLGDLIHWSWLTVDAYGIGFTLPLWIPFAVFAVPTGLLWGIDWLFARRIPVGHCRRCGYNLTGNVSG